MSGPLPPAAWLCFEFLSMEPRVARSSSLRNPLQKCLNVIPPFQSTKFMKQRQSHIFLINMKLEWLSFLAIKIYSRLFFCQGIKSQLFQHVLALTLIWGNWCSLFYKCLYLRYKFTKGDILLYLGNMEKMYVICKKAKKNKKEKEILCR